MPIRRALRNGLGGIFFVIAGVCPALATTFTVTSTADSGAGSLRDAVFQARPGDTITFEVSGTISHERTARHSAKHHDRRSGAERTLHFRQSGNARDRGGRMAARERRDLGRDHSRRQRALWRRNP